MIQSDNAYSAIAEVYDALNAEIDYESWADFIERLFARHLPARPALVLDLACGTGRMTRTLAARGYDMIGVDNSIDMLSVALDRSEGGILYLNQDMTSFELYGTVGAVTCCLDSLNYLLEEEALRACFATVHNYLDPDGVFVFDLNTPYKFEHIYANQSYILEDEIDGRAVYCGWQNDYDRESDICTFALSVFSEGEDGAYERADEVQYERCYAPAQIETLLVACGFELCGVYGDLDFGAPTPTSERLYFAARCKK